MLSRRRVTSVSKVALVVLATCLGVWWQTEGTRWRPDAERRKAVARQVPRVVWTRRAEGAHTVVLDARGTHVGLAGPEGQVRILEARGDPALDRRVGRVDALALTVAGNLVVAFRRGDPSETRLHLLHLDGSDVGTYNAREAIVAAASSADGERVACVTTGRHVHILALDRGMRARRWRAVGTPTQVYVGAHGSLVVVATQAPPGVRAYTPEGRLAWKAPLGETEGSAALFVSPDGKFMACAATRSATAGDGVGSRFVIMSASGSQQWGARLRAHSPRIGLSAEGRFAALTYVRTVSSRGRSIAERKVALFETPRATLGLPQPLWQHGGHYYDPRLVAVAADGSFVVTRDGARSLHFFGSNGQLLWRQKMPAAVVSTAASADGRSILVHCADDTVTLLRMATGRG